MRLCCAMQVTTFFECHKVRRIKLRARWNDVSEEERRAFDGFCDRVGGNINRSSALRFSCWSVGKCGDSAKHTSIEHTIFATAVAQPLDATST